MKARRPYNYKTSIDDPFMQVGKTGDVLKFNGFQTSDAWTVMEVGENKKIYLSMFSAQNDLDYEIEKSWWLDDRVRKSIRKNRNDVVGLLGRVHGHLFLQQNSFFQNQMPNLSYSRVLNNEAKNQAELDLAVEVMQAVTNVDQGIFSHYATSTHVLFALERAISWLKEAE